MATIVDLAQRGVLQLHEEEPNRWTIKRGPSFNSAPLEPFERLLIKRLELNTRDSRSVDSLHQKFYSHLPALQKRIYNALVQRGYYTRSPEATRSNYKVLATLLVVLAFMALIAAIAFAEWANFGFSLRSACLLLALPLPSLPPTCPCARTKALRCACALRRFGATCKTLSASPM